MKQKQTVTKYSTTTTVHSTILRYSQGDIALRTEQARKRRTWKEKEEKKDQPKRVNRRSFRQDPPKPSDTDKKKPRPTPTRRRAVAGKTCCGCVRSTEYDIVFSLLAWPCPFYVLVVLGAGEIVHKTDPHVGHVCTTQGPLRAQVRQTAPNCPQELPVIHTGSWAIRVGKKERSEEMRG